MGWSIKITLFLLVALPHFIDSFWVSPLSSCRPRLNSLIIPNYYKEISTRIEKKSVGLNMAYGYQDGRSKRQERVGHLVRSEIASIINLGNPLSISDENIEDELRRRISIVNADVSPDLRQARITVSIIGQSSASPEDMMDKRRAYSWLVSNAYSIRHELAKRLSHLKVLPNLTFVEVDVASAVDVMQLIDKVSQGYKRESLEDDDFDYDEDDDDDFEFMDDEMDFDDDGEDDDDWDDSDEEGDDDNEEKGGNRPILNIEDL